MFVTLAQRSLQLQVRIGAATMSPRTVAIVDDDPAFTDVIAEFLAIEGYQTVAWRGEVDPVEVIRRERPDVVILDVRLTNGLGGLGVLTELRADPDLHDLPVVVCTADSRFLREHGDELAALHADTLEKPFDLDDLTTKIDTALNGDPRPSA